MTNKTSSRKRLQQLADEAAAPDEQKVEKKKTTGTTTRKKASAAADRKKLVWKVFNDSYKEMACFPYPEKEKAYSAAEELTKKNGKNYFVNNVTVPMEEE